MIFLEENDQRFYIDHSTLPNAGKGLFAKEKILKGSRLDVVGVRIKIRGVSDICTEYANRYKYYSKDFIIIPVGYAAMINFHGDKEFENVYFQHIDEGYLETSKDININDELFLYGGKDIEICFERKDLLYNNIEKNSNEQNEFFLENFYNLSFLKD